MLVQFGDATPTKYVDKCGGYDDIVIQSYFVHSCPQYKGDPKQMVYVRDIAAIINKSERTVFRYLTTKRTRLYLRELLKEQGYILHICKEICNDCGEGARTYYLEKINK